MPEQDSGKHNWDDYQMLWDCRFCNTKNLLGKTHRHCPTCGAAQDPAWRYYPADEERVAYKDHPYVGADTICPACKQPNSAANVFCTVCGANLATGQGKRKHPPDAKALEIERLKAAPERNRHLFMSYSRSDTSIMERVCVSLRKAGLSVWTDQNITPGTPSWRRAIETAIVEAVGLVVIFSPDARQSEWVNKELEFAEIQGRMIFPILARGTPAESIPFGFTSAQYIDIRDKAKYSVEIDKLIGSIRTRIEAK